jgi:hypothetical protein
MSKWIEIATFNYPHEAHLAKSKLESEGIDVWLKDEYTAQVYHFHSNAIGGVKLCIEPKNKKAALMILYNSEIQLKAETKGNKYLLKFDSISSNLPFLKGKSLIIRLLAVVGIIFSLLIGTLFILDTPKNNYALEHNY